MLERRLRAPFFLRARRGIQSPARPKARRSLLGVSALDIFLQQVINGLTLGSVYAIVALGYTMVYGIIQLINFAHGEVVMIGAMVAYTVIVVLTKANTGLPPLAVVLAGLMVALPACIVLFVVECALLRAFWSAASRRPTKRWQASALQESSHLDSRKCHFGVREVAPAFSCTSLLVPLPSSTEEGNFD